MVKLKTGTLTSLPTSQFKALLLLDLLRIVQGHYFIFVLRMLIPSGITLILYLLHHTANIKPITIVPDPINSSALNLPECYVLTGDSDKQGLGAKNWNAPCKTIGYYPKNSVTDGIMIVAAQSMNLSLDKILGYNNQSEFNQSQFFNLFGVEFVADFTEEVLDDSLKNMSIVIYYNQSYLDQPGFFTTYGDEKFGKQLGYFYSGFTLYPWSSFPLAIQSHILSAIMSQENIKYDPVFRQIPYYNSNSVYQPDRYISADIFALVYIFQFIFTIIQISQDKSGMLDTIRLVGTSDIIYILETLVFQYGVYILTVCGQCFIMYAFPGGCGVFQYIDQGLITILLLTAGFYATCFAIFVGMILTEKQLQNIIIVMFGLYVTMVMCFGMFNFSMIYDTSILPNWLWILMRLFYPFSYVLSLHYQIFDLTRYGSIFQNDSLSYVVQVSSTTYLWKDFLTPYLYRTGNFDGSILFNHPSGSITTLYAILQSIAFLFFGWMLGEFIPINSSACRPPWTLFRISKNSSGYTIGNAEQQKRFNFKSRIDSSGRKALSQEQAQRCLLESMQQGDSSVTKEALTIMTQQNVEDKVLVSHHLHKSFRRSCFKKQSMIQGPEHYAVQSVSICVKRGEIYGLAGHNGAGKSTTLGLITGAVPMDRRGYSLFKNDKTTRNYINNAWLDNYHSIRDDIIQIRQNLGFCPQFNTNVFKELTVKQNIEFMCRIQNMPYYDQNRQIEIILRQMNLLHLENKKLNELSGGMQRRVSVAMALVNSKSRLIILDEPTTGLDPVTKRVIWANIKKAAREKRKSPIITGTSKDHVKFHRIRQNLPGIIITSHDMDELNSICDSINIMSAGQLVAQGTALDLKRKYGLGYTLSIVAKSTQQCEYFKRIFNTYISRELHMTLQSSHEEQNQKSVRVIDQSGSVIQYSFPNTMEGELIKTIYYLEKQMESGEYIQDFCLERTSMDEVFVTVGKQFKLANGAEFEPEDTLPHRFSQEKQDSELGNSGISNIEFTSDESIDIEMNGKQINIAQLSKEEIRKILSPPRSQPKIMNSLLYKLIHNDHLHRLGIAGYVILPIIMLLLSFLTENTLIPKMQSDYLSWYDREAKQLSGICNLCEVMKVNNFPLPSCKGYDAWGFPNLCKEISIAQMASYQSPVVWYGGDIRTFNNQSNLYTQQQSQVFVNYFDKNNILGKSQQQSISAVMLQGNQQFEKAQFNGYTFSKKKYVFQNDQGYPDSPSQIQQQLYAAQQIEESKSILEQMAFKPLSVQYISQNNELLNSFSLLRDIQFLNAYDVYENEYELDQYYQRILLQKQLRHFTYPATRNYDCQTSTCVETDDYYGIQAIKQQIAIQLPIGYISFDMQDTKNNTEYTPFITSFAPSRNSFDFYNNYRLHVIWKYSKQLNDSIGYLNQDSSGKNVASYLRKSFDFQIVPSPTPSILDTGYFENMTVNPSTSLIDISVRLGNAILRNVTHKDINLRFGTQMFQHIPISTVNVAGITASSILTCILAVIATFSAMLKFGQHVVLDRKTEMRRALHLNGVKNSKYWSSTIIYSLIIAIFIQIEIIILGCYVFQIKSIIKINSSLLVLLCCAGALSCVSVSLFISSFTKQTGVFTVVAILILILSSCVIMMRLDSIGDEAPWYAFVIPSIGYALLLLYSSYAGPNPSQLFDTNFGNLLVWLFVESVLFLLLSIYFDSILNLNGFSPKKPWWVFGWCGRSSNDTEMQATNNATKQQKIEAKDEIEAKIQVMEQPNMQNKKIDTDCMKGQVELNSVDGETQRETTRDQAAMHELNRMDADVLAERRLIQKGNIQNSPLLAVNLQKKFGQFVAVRDISFHIPINNNEGSVFALLGPNGAAKSTMMNMMIGLLKPTKGKAFIHKHDMSDSKQAELAYRNIGYCSQFDVFLPKLTVREHLVLFAMVHGVQQKQINEVVEKLAAFVHLGEVLDKPVGQLSGGMKRRMSLALALIG